MAMKFLFLTIILLSQLGAMQPTEIASQSIMRRFLGSIPKPYVLDRVRWSSSYSHVSVPPFKGKFVNVQPDGFVNIHQAKYPKFKGFQNVIQTFRRTGPAFDLGDLLCYPVDPNPSLLDPKAVEAQLTNEPYEIISPESAAYSPHFSCGKIDMCFPRNSKSESFTASGSGAAIDRNLVVTAAHNFLPPSLLENRSGRIVPNDEKVKAETVYFLHLLTNNGQYQRGTHVSPVTTHCFIHPKWESNFDPHYDIAFFFLSESMDITTDEAKRLLKLRIVPPNLVSSVQVIGYPNGIPSMHESKGNNDHRGDDILSVVYHTANTLSGSSGSPIVDDQKGLIGIHTRGTYPGGTHNHGVRIRHDLMPFLEECIADHQLFLVNSEKFLFDQESKKKAVIEAQEEKLREQGREQGREQVREQGRSEGELRKSQEVARASIAKGLDNDTIVAITGMTTEQVQALRRS